MSLRPEVMTGQCLCSVCPLQKTRAEERSKSKMNYSIKEPHSPASHSFPAAAIVGFQAQL
eukprot:scaffold16453_cov67-Skeletonema_marinoi.AAC.2